MFKNTNKKNRIAFTISELLMSLAIIGIIAAMTIPNLYIKAQEQAHVTKLKSIYSQLSNAVKLAMQEQGPPDEWITTGTTMYDKTTHIEFANAMIPFLKVHKNCIGMSADDSMKYCYVPSMFSSPSSFTSVFLEDGTAVSFRIWNKNCDANYGFGKIVCGTIEVTLNAKKEKLKRGYNQFGIFLTKNGLVPFGVAGQNTLIFEKACNKLEPNPYPGFTPGNMYMCTAWVIYKGNMDYWHCNDLSWSGKDKCSK